MTQTPTTKPPPSVAFDWTRYADHLEAWDVPDNVKQEFIETMFGILTVFVDLGFEVREDKPEISGHHIDLAGVLEAAVLSSEDQQTDRRAS